MLDVDFVIAVHDEIIATFNGLPGLAGGGKGGVEAALSRVENYRLYADLDDVFGIAALYAEAIARGHVFNDANKRTALTCSITYLKQQGFTVQKAASLEDLTVELAEGRIDWQRFAVALAILAGEID